MAGITIFHPDLRESGNNGGLCVLASHEKYDILITGDLSQNAEYRLLSRYDLRDIELLVAGHHGAATSTSDALLQRTGASQRRHFRRRGEFLRSPGGGHACAHSKYRRGNLPDGCAGNHRHPGRETYGKETGGGSGR